MAPSPAPPQAIALEQVLERAGRYVAALEESLALVRAKERYVQTRWKAEPGGLPSAPRQTRTLEADVLWVPAGEPILWAFYRDVESVDGKPVRDREERLAALFADGASQVARQEAGRILEESARFNIGVMRRNTTSPTLAIVFLHPSNQFRCRFKLARASVADGRVVQEVTFDEKRHPTLVRSPVGRDRASSGRFWIAVEDGSVRRSEMSIEQAQARFEVTYARDPASGLYLPAELRERYGRGTAEEVDTVATYSGFARGETGVGAIQVVH